MSLGGGVGGGRALALAAWGEALVAVGTFSAAGQQLERGVAVWDGRRWEGIGDLYGDGTAVAAHLVELGGK